MFDMSSHHPSFLVPSIIKLLVVPFLIINLQYSGESRNKISTITPKGKVINITLNGTIELPNINT